MEDDNCVSCNYALVSQQCELSNGTKALFPDEQLLLHLHRDALIDLCLTSVSQY